MSDIQSQFAGLANGQYANAANAANPFQQPMAMQPAAQPVAQPAAQKKRPTAIPLIVFCDKHGSAPGQCQLFLDDVPYNGSSFYTIDTVDGIRLNFPKDNQKGNYRYNFKDSKEVEEFIRTNKEKLEVVIGNKSIIDPNTGLVSYTGDETYTLRLRTSRLVSF